MNRDKNSPKDSPPDPQAGGASPAEPEYPPGSHLDEFFRTLKPGMRRPKPSQVEMAAALESVQRLAAEADAEDATDDIAEQASAEISGAICSVCGHHNRGGNKFCGMCGQAIHSTAELRGGLSQPEERIPSEAGAAPHEPVRGERHGLAETHHYHHHYHHHYFPAGHESGPARARVEAGRDAERLRPAAVRAESMSRAEAAVRRITQEWVLACNTKHLDDLLELYVADALVLRSNCPAVRGAAALRELFFGALDAGLGDVELEPIRVEVVGDLAYEAGRCKALVPGATGKRREERGKYLWVFARQSNGEWKLATDCWSSDLTLASVELDVPPSTTTKPSPSRKGA